MKNIVKFMSSKEFDILLFAGTAFFAVYNSKLLIPAIKTDKRFKDIK